MIPDGLFGGTPCWRDPLKLRLLSAICFYVTAWGPKTGITWGFPVRRCLLTAFPLPLPFMLVLPVEPLTPPLATVRSRKQAANCHKKPPLLCIYTGCEKCRETIGLFRGKVDILEDYRTYNVLPRDTAKEILRFLTIFVFYNTCGCIMRDFENRDVARIVGVNPRTLIDWSTRGLVIPEVQDASGTGSRRRYSEQNLVELAVVKALLADGIRRGLVREMMGVFRIVRSHQKGNAFSPFSLETPSDESGIEYLIMNLATSQALFMHVSTGHSKHHREAKLVQFAEQVLSIERAYVLNISRLKDALRETVKE